MAVVPNDCNPSPPPPRIELGISVSIIDLGNQKMFLLVITIVY